MTKLLRNIYFYVIYLGGNHCYVGQTVMPGCRSYRHERSLRTGCHKNLYMQRCYDKYQVYSYHLLPIVCRTADSSEAAKQERLYCEYFIDKGWAIVNSVMPDSKNANYVTRHMLETRLHLSDAMTIAHKRVDYKAKHSHSLRTSKRARQYHSDSRTKLRLSDFATERFSYDYERQAISTSQKLYFSKAENRSKLSEAIKTSSKFQESINRPERLAKLSKSMSVVNKQRWQNADYKIKVGLAIHENHSTADYKRKASEARKNLWQTEEYRRKQLEANNRQETRLRRGKVTGFKNKYKTCRIYRYEHYVDDDVASDTHFIIQDTVAIFFNSIARNVIFVSHIADIPTDYKKCSHLDSYDDIKITTDTYIKLIW